MFNKKLKTKSVILGRRKRDIIRKNEDDLMRPCFIDLFDTNNPHLSDKAPKKIFEFDKKHKIIINGLNINYLLLGNDIVINDLKEIEIKEEGEHIYITGKQE